jgi:low affinity Fe/Cu permease
LSTNKALLIALLPVVVAFLSVDHWLLVDTLCLEVDTVRVDTVRVGTVGVGLNMVEGFGNTWAVLVVQGIAVVVVVVVVVGLQRL